MNKKVVLITDAVTEIGKSIVDLFASKNYNIVICYNNNRKEANCLKKCIKNNYKIEVQTIKLDVSSSKKVKQAISRVIKKFGRIDVLINNSGISYEKDFNKLTIDEYESIFKLMIGGSIIISKEVSKHMKKDSAIVNISSTADNTNDNSSSASCFLDYNISKLGLQSITRDLAFELRPNIRVNAVAIKLDKSIKSKRKTQKKEAKLNNIAKTIYYLSNDDSKNINGEIATIN